MNDTNIQEAPEGEQLLDPEQFLRKTPVWRQMQFDALKASLRQAATDYGLEIVAIEHINLSVIRLAAYVGTRMNSA